LTSIDLRRDIAYVIVFIMGIITTVEYFVVSPGLRSISADVQSWATIVAAFSLGVGSINLLRIHGRQVVKRGQGYYNNAVLLAGMCMTIVVGLWGTTSHPTYQFIFFNILYPSDTAVWSLLGFYIASAAVRTLRIRTKEGAVLLVAGILTLIKNSPTMGVVWGGFSVIGDWLLSVPNSAAVRGIMICSAIGVLALGLRVLLRQERTSLGGR